MVRKEVKVKRGCGYRKVGGLYLAGPLLSAVCDRLPFKLAPCPICMHEHGFNRGIAKVTACGIFYQPHVFCKCELTCPVCIRHIDFRDKPKPAGLMWVGKKFYTPESFTKEAQELGVSKRLPYVPKWLKVGETWVFLAHPEAVDAENVPGDNDGDQGALFKKVPGVFYAFVPQKIEKIMTENKASGLSQEEIDKLDADGIDIVTVPDSDSDYR